MDLAILVLIALVLGGATTGALVRTWSLHVRTFALENRMSEVEGSLTRVVKQKAADERWRGSGTKADAELSKLAALAQQAPPRQPVVWWGTKAPQ